MTKVYCDRAGSYHPEFTAFVVICGALSLGVVVYTAWSSGLVDWSLLWGLFPLVAVWLILDARDNKAKGPTVLKLDEDGCTFAYLWMTRRWAWRELSQPEIERGDTLGTPFIRLRPVKALDWMGRLNLPGASLTGREVRIQPVFDAPLADILAEMRTYRDRATAAPGA